MAYRGAKPLISRRIDDAAASGGNRHRPRLLGEIRSRSRLKHYNVRTEKGCLYWILVYIHGNGCRHPRGFDGVYSIRAAIAGSRPSPG